MKVSCIIAAASIATVLAACSSGSSTGSGTHGGAGTSSSGGSSGGSGSASSSGGSSSGASSGSSGSSSGSSSGGSGGGQDAGGVPANDAKLVLDVPSTFTGTTRELDVVVTPTLPIAGPPAGTLAQIEKPILTAGQPLTVHGDATGITGSYYVVAVLYMQGGGQFQPKAGVDYEAQSTAPSSFTGSAIDLGTLSLELVGGDAGP